MTTNQPLLPINEIFPTLQGEGIFTGMPSIFVRLQGCAVGCPWCDTKHTWDLDTTNRISFTAMCEKLTDSPTYAMSNVPEITHEITKHSAKHVVITGGEPCMHDLFELTDMLRMMNYTVQVETSGTQPIFVHPKTWITLSPKIDMPGGYRVMRHSMGQANELKMPIGKQSDVDLFRRFLVENARVLQDVKHIWLQPLSQSPKATDICVDAAAKHGWRVSLQTHKYHGLR